MKPSQTLVRLVLDTNILICALITKGTPPDQLVQSWKQGRFSLVTSRAQLDEFEAVYMRRKLRRYLAVHEAMELHDTIADVAVVMETLPEVDASPDPDDNLILATAIAGEVDPIVSGDKRHMLSLGRIEGIPIVTPREALLRLQEK